MLRYQRVERPQGAEGNDEPSSRSPRLPPLADTPPESAAPPRTDRRVFQWRPRSARFTGACAFITGQRAPSLDHEPPVVHVHSAGESERTLFLRRNPDFD